MLRSKSSSLLLNKQKLLFTPGPLLTTPSVKQAMQVDYGSRDTFFMETVAKIRQGVVDIAGISSPEEKAKWACIPMQGSGTMGVEAAISTCAPRTNPKALVVCNGAYGVRHAAICRRLGIETSTFAFAEGAAIDLQKFEDAIKQTKDLTTFVTVHSETSTGVINPIEEMTPIVKRHHPNATVIVDAMSSFGGFPMQTDKVCDVLVSSFNKCIQGVPGASICLARKDFITQCKYQSRSFTLDLTMQLEALEKSGQFPFTPPTHVIVAFRQALEELEQEGGVEARYNRFKSNSDFVIDEMLNLGFSLFIKDRKAKHLGPFIVPFDVPSKKTGWEFNWFYEFLRQRNCVIYPGKASQAETFRIGCIGDLHRKDFVLLIDSVKAALDERKINLRQ
jgi:2-aminoethylphosphonate-pyruvate transaminase